MMRMRTIVLAFSCAASSLTLIARVSSGAPPQAQEQRAVEVNESSSGAEANKVSATKKNAAGLEAEPFEGSYRGFSGLGKRFLEDQEQIWTSPAKVRFADTEWLVALRGVAWGVFVNAAPQSRRISREPIQLSTHQHVL